jgi:hypothetical protein
MQGSLTILRHQDLLPYAGSPENCGELDNPLGIFTTSQVIGDAFAASGIMNLNEVLSLGYGELGETLHEYTICGGEWGIDQSVYNAAVYVASGLMITGRPAPEVFTHGPGSIVFNWVNYTNQNILYLTISSDKISALLSSPSGILKREDAYPLQQYVESFFPASKESGSTIDSSHD